MTEQGELLMHSKAGMRSFFITIAEYFHDPEDKTKLANAASALMLVFQHFQHEVTACNDMAIYITGRVYPLFGYALAFFLWRSLGRPNDGEEIDRMNKICAALYANLEMLYPKD